MIRLGQIPLRTCAGTSRREFLEVGGAGLLGLSLSELFRAQALGYADPGNDVSCILLFLWGGPPQSDTYDLKPNAPEGVRGLFKPIATQVPGIQISEHLPRLARNNKLFTIVRSATHQETEHPRAAHYMMTGNQVLRGTEWPNLGATVSKFATGPRNPVGSVVVGPRLVDQPITPTGQDGGFLGNMYSPFRVADATQPLEKIASMTPPAGVTPQRTARRGRLYRTVQQFQQHVESDETAVLDSAYERAFALATSPRAKAAFDLSREPETARDAYGRYPFGQGALMARRLVEAGVRFVQVNWREHPIREYGFDNHGDNFNKLQKHQLPQIDQTVTTLLGDLKSRGMLEKTLVFVTGEFGRTPKINGSAGRDHWPFCFSYLLAGAGIPGGRVIGASDRLAAYPVLDPVSPQQTAVSVFRRLGLDLDRLQAERVIEQTDGIPHLLS